MAAVGGFAAGRLMQQKRKRWETATKDSVDEMLDSITTYDICRGAGKLLAGWLEYETPEITPAEAEARLRKLIAEMDKVDETHFDRARSRLIASKALFYLEGFRLKNCRYESLQTDVRDLLRRNPQRKDLSRRDVFLGKPFEPELLIGTTHRMLVMMSGKKLGDYLARLAERGQLRDEGDYMALLIVLTFRADDEDLDSVIESWFEAYRDFKLDQTHRQEAWIQTSINAATGGLPGALGMDLLKRIGKKWLEKAER